MEVYGSVGTFFRDSSTTSAVTFSNSLLLSAAEYKNSFTLSKSSTTEQYSVGGDIILKVGCTQDNASMVIGSTQVDFKVGASIVFSAPYSQYKTVQDLIALVNSQSTFSASIGSSKYLFVAPSSLDRGTFYISRSNSAHQPCRIKEDAVQWSEMIAGSALAIPELSSQSGLPEPSAVEVFFSGGSKAGSTSASFVAAIDALEMVDTNFVVPLVSKDASDDISDGFTESSSTYTVDAVNAYLKSHVLKMSALKARKNRIAVGSRSGSYEDQKNAAGLLSSYRFGMAFQDVRVVNGSGVLEQFQPWMAAVVAAGMQAAAGYKGIVKKFANVFGVIKPEGDFNPARNSELEDALKAGLLILERVPTGGFRWVSDQMTYSVDNNFVYNSLQAVYIVDLMIMTLIQNFDRAVVGKSVAEVSATVALSFLDGQCFNFKRLRWIAASDDAPKGYKNARVKITGGVMEVSLEVKLAGIIYFVPISFTISQVVQEEQG
jgi:hypothetical protein